MGHREVVRTQESGNLLEMLPQEGYFMNEVFQANDTKLPQVLFNHSAVCQRDGLTLNLCLSTFQDQFSDRSDLEIPRSHKVPIHKALSCFWE
jgi:hypothetical protein